MSDEELAAIESRIGESSPGPWFPYWDFQHIGDKNFAFGYVRTENYSFHIQTCTPESTEKNKGDMEFVAHARHDIPALLSEIRALKAALSKAEARREHSVYWLQDDFTAKAAALRAKIEGGK